MFAQVYKYIGCVLRLYASVKTGIYNQHAYVVPRFVCWFLDNIQPCKSCTEGFWYWKSFKILSISWCLREKK